MANDTPLRQGSDGSAPYARARVPFRALLPYVVITFAIAWGVLALYITLPERMSAWFGQLTGDHPLFYLAVYAPAIAAFIIVARCGGAGGVRRFLSRVGLWRCSAGWYVFIAVCLPAVFYLGALIKGQFSAPPAALDSWQGVLVAVALMLVKGPVEEFGWRGLALPLLQRRFAPIWAGLIVGIVWGVWHLPAFCLSSTPQSAWPFAPFFLGSVALSIIVTPMFNRSGGSILLPALFHFQAINPLWPDAQPYDTYMLVVVAIVIVWLNRQSMFTSADAVTRVIPDRAE